LLPGKAQTECEKVSGAEIFLRRGDTEKSGDAEKSGFMSGDEDTEKRLKVLENRL
jgi:hypothetical protein